MPTNAILFYMLFARFFNFHWKTVVYWMNICLKILARLIVIAMGESVSDILIFFKKYIQVHSLCGDFIFKFPSISVLPFCILFFLDY